MSYEDDAYDRRRDDWACRPDEYDTRQDMWQHETGRREMERLAEFDLGTGRGSAPRYASLMTKRGVV